MQRKYVTIRKVKSCISIVGILSFSKTTICSSCSYHPVHTHIQIHVHICIHISICSQGKIQNHDTGDEHTTVLQSEQCIYMKGTKTVLSVQLYLNQLFHIFYIFLFPPRSASFFFFFFCLCFYSLPSNDNIFTCSVPIYIS